MRDGGRVAAAAQARAGAVLVATAALLVGPRWPLFADGPGESRALEVRVDGAAVYRSGDATAAWDAPALRDRHVRPLLAAWTAGSDGPEARAFAAWACERAVRAFPDSEDIALVAVWRPFVGAAGEARTELGPPVEARRATCRTPGTSE